MISREGYLGWRPVLLESPVKLSVVGWVGMRGVEGGVVGARSLVLIAPLHQSQQLLRQLPPSAEYVPACVMPAALDRHPSPLVENHHDAGPITEDNAKFSHDFIICDISP